MIRHTVRREAGPTPISSARRGAGSFRSSERPAPGQEAVATALAYPALAQVLRSGHSRDVYSSTSDPGGLEMETGSLKGRP